MNITQSVKKDLTPSSGLIFKTKISSLFIPWDHLQYIELLNESNNGEGELVFYFSRHIVFMTAPMDILEYALEGSSKKEVSQLMFNELVKLKIEERVG